MRGGVHARRRPHVPVDETVQKLKASPWKGGALNIICFAFFDPHSSVIQNETWMWIKKSKKLIFVQLLKV